MSATVTSIAPPADLPVAAKKHRARYAPSAWILMVLLAIGAIFINIPIILTVINSFRPNLDILSGTALFPQRTTLANYTQVFQHTDFPVWFRNSIIIAILTTVLTLAAAGCAGYSLSRYRTRVNAGYSSALMAFQLFPISLSVIALFVLFSKVKLMGTPWPVAILYVVMSLPFSTWMFKGFFDSIPRELEEAARVDGCTSFQSMIRIVLPLAGPGAAAVAIYTFLQAYNEYMVASAFLSGKAIYNTVPVGMRSFIGYSQVDWGALLAASTIAAIPPFVMFLLVQKWMIKGMAAGAVKG